MRGACASVAVWPKLSMSKNQRSVVTLAAMASLSLSAPVSHAAGAADNAAPVVVHVAYRASAGCPPASRFMAEVSARLTRPARFGDEPGADVFVVSIEQTGSIVHAELGVTRANAPSSVRRFELSSCEDAVVALALVTALAIDPHASTAPGSALEPKVRPVSSTEPPRPELSPTRPTVTRRAGSDRTLLWAAEVAASVAVTTGPAPVALVSGGVETSLNARAESASTLAPRFALGLFASRTGLGGPAIDEATFSWALLRGSACPLRFALRPWVLVRPCVTVDAGWTTAKADETESVDGTSASTPWVALGPSLLAQVGRGRPFLSLGGGPLLALTRPTYILAGPRSVVHDVPPVAWTAQLALGFRL
jgi:hypothetical protein